MDTFIPKCDALLAQLPNEIAYFGLDKQFDACYKALPKIHSDQGFIGLEFEIEKIHVPNCPSMWQMKNDPSLKDSGVEFVSIPIQGDVIRVAVAYLQSFLAKYNKKPPSYSWRTSTHVHLNVQDFTVEEAMKFLLLYLIFEHILFVYAGEDRAGTNFCVPIYNTDYAEHNIHNGLVWLKKDILEGVLNDCFQYWEKYSALNLGRLGDLGTMEFRHLGGTADYNKVITWVNMILALRNATKKIPLDELIQEIEQLNTTSHYQLFKERVFSPELAKVFPEIGIEMLMSKGIMMAKSAIVQTEDIKKEQFASSAFMEYVGTLNLPKPELSEFGGAGLGIFQELHNVNPDAAAPIPADEVPIGWGNPPKPKVGEVFEIQQEEVLNVDEAVAKMKANMIAAKKKQQHHAFNVKLNQNLFIKPKKAPF